MCTYMYIYVDMSVRVCLYSKCVQTLYFSPMTGIRIRSDDDIVVQAISLSAFGTSSWEVPPIEKLGRIHVLMTPVYATVPTNQGSYQILVVAPSAGTTVEVELNGPWDYRVEFDGINYNNSDMIYIELRQYQVAQVRLFVK